MQSSQQFIDLETKVGAHNYHPIPVVLKCASGVTATDVEGVEYLDFLSAYSAVNQGHCHPRIVDALCHQAKHLDATSRAFHNDQLPQAQQKLVNLFKYDKVLFMNTGVEAVETGLKLARRWAYDVKKIPSNDAFVIVAENNFHGRTIATISMSTDADSYGGFGPLLPGFLTARFGDIFHIQKLIEENASKLAAVILEPIQGEAGVVVPPEGYLSQVADSCKRHNVLFILDEIQTGLGRTGALCCHFHEPGLRPDILLLGKALGGGVYPVSAVLADDSVMLTIKPGQHGSTYGGNAIACAVAIASLDVILDEALSEKAKESGAWLQGALIRLQNKYPDKIACVRGRGLMQAIVLDPHYSAWDLCLILKQSGLLTKPTHDHIIRLAPPLIISRKQLVKAESILDASLDYLSLNINNHY